MQSTQPLLRILHFNDVYDIQPNTKTQQAGAYYFKAHLQQHRNKNTITLFSGDAFSPSVLSNLFQGQQMVHCLNEFKIDVACYGNHEFDYEVEHTIQLAKKCNFPWLLGNLIDNRTSKPLGDAQQYIVLEKNGLKIGVFGIAQQEWLQLLTQNYQDDLIYIDYIEYSKMQIEILKKEYKCDLIIALAHMRIPNDRKLADAVPEIDFILGGHDHIKFHEVINNVQVIISGSNFYNYSVIDIYQKNKQCEYKGKNFNYEIKLHKTVKTDKYDQELKKFVDQKLVQYEKENNRIIGYTAVELETRFNKIRTQETNYGNFVTDMVRAFYNCDVVLINSGGLRIDELIPVGPLKFSTIGNIFDDFLVVKQVPGDVLQKALENAVSKYPTYQGRFLQVSGIKFAFDPQKQPGFRILKNSIYIKSQPLEPEKNYKIAMHSYTAKGGDGYTMFQKCKYKVTNENAIRMAALLTRFYKPTSLNKNDQQTHSPTMLKKRSSNVDRMSQLIKSTIEVNGRYFYQIQPYKEGRITMIKKQ